MRKFILATALTIAAAPVSSAPIQSYADCIKALDQALTVTSAVQSLSSSTMQSVKGDKISTSDGSEVSLLATHSEVIKANTSFVNVLADVCQTMR
ncbi:hypothetical protein [Paenirhodobacter populi]|uniref:hypothetical protein n=1 Tax=Paenirhodobacter populi TaxID=2306993 RepID=UPI000FE3EA57|nr:hypothetical protein [Sinirhodobacter populi]RWR09806.1 hypothetical protein D2T32_05555 [Sinirhodobacter populi]